ncbi:hydantoinase/oxoprolinase family protein [Candidatus Poribacteria bacterium]
MSKVLHIGVDIGGTFTDFITVHETKVIAHKVLSTPDNPASAVLSGIAQILEITESIENPTVDMVHGSTVATNALLEHKGALTALITTKGFEDVIEIGRQNRPELYDFSVEKPQPLVLSDFRFGVAERTTYSGEIAQSISEREIEILRNRLEQSDVESIAICFLFSYANSENEAAVYHRLQNLNLPISVSHIVIPEYREYERFSTTVVNAYVAPVMQRYINALESGLNGRLRIMQSNGGSISAKTACEKPVHTILSGPAGGVVGAMEIARNAGFEKIITFDMGGTSTDVSLCDGEIQITTEGEIGGYPIKVPLIDIHTIGAGGGSISYLDEGGALRVGPESAGADPGPICYGRGDRLTMTDANLLLGRLDASRFLGGNMVLNTQKAQEAMNAFAEKLNYTPSQAAEGIIAVVNAKMKRAIRVISIERGYDTREFALVSFGGAGGLHACELAKNLSIPVVLIPNNPGILSAFGMLISDVVKSYSQTVLLKLRDTSYQELLKVFKTIEGQAYTEMQAEGFAPSEIIFQRTIDMRYEGQSYEVNVPFDEMFLDHFNRIYKQRFGYHSTENVIEIVTLRINAIAPVQEVPLRREKIRGADPSAALLYKRQAMISGKAYEVSVYDRERLLHGNVINGPAIVAEYSATTLIPPDLVCQVDEYSNLLIRLEKT